MPTPNLSVAVPKLDPAGAFVTIAFTEVAVVRIAPPYKTDFNRTLRSEITGFRPEAQFGVFDRTQYNPRDENHAKFVRLWQQALGWDESKGVPDGYYVFVGGKLSGYHPPLPDDDDANEQIAKASVAGLALLAAMIFDSKPLAQASLGVLESEHGKKAAAFFKQMITNAEAAAKAAAAEKKAREADEARRKAQAKVMADDLTAKFKLFELVRGTATEAALKSAKRKLAHKIHPDKGPENEKEFRTKLMQYVNETYEVVLEAIRKDAKNTAKKTGT